eukprot:7581296-Prorocentrum_lima.AAC.1
MLLPDTAGRTCMPPGSQPWLSPRGFCRETMLRKTARVRATHEHPNAESGVVPHVGTRHMSLRSPDVTPP